MSKYTIHFDGACWPNPNGKAGYGFTIDQDGVEIAAEAGITGEGTGMSNNVAEFDALSRALEALLKLHPASDSVVEVYGDSNLVVKIMRLEWGPKIDKLYYPYYLTCAGNAGLVETLIQHMSFTWIPREKNTRCDDLSKTH